MSLLTQTRQGMGAHRMARCSKTLTPIAASNHRLRHGGTAANDRFSLSAFNALNISTITSTLMDTVLGRRSRKMAHE